MATCLESYINFFPDDSTASPGLIFDPAGAVLFPFLDSRMASSQMDCALLELPVRQMIKMAILMMAKFLGRKRKLNFS